MTKAHALESVPQNAHRLTAYLPAIYREQSLVRQYLWAFEQLLVGLEQRIEDLPKYFDPKATPDEFLPWLASWVAFTLRAELEPAQQRAFIERIVPLYRRRGTKENLEQLLTIFIGPAPKIEEPEDGDPHRFRITLRLGPATPDKQLRLIATAHALIDLEKPAHTYYDLDLQFPTMQIAVTSTIGQDTLLGTIDDATTTTVPATPTKTKTTAAKPATTKTATTKTTTTKTTTTKATTTKPAAEPVANPATTPPAKKKP